MFFAAIDRPNPDIGVCGRIYIESIISEGTSKRTSKNRVRGSRQIQNAAMDTTKLNDVTMNTLREAAMKFPRARTITIIVDGDVGHGAGQGSQCALERVLSPTISWIAKSSNDGGIFHGKAVSMICQPAQSPDVNMPDLGAWLRGTQGCGSG